MSGKKLQNWGARFGRWPLNIKLALFVMLIFAVGAGALFAFVVGRLQHDLQQVIAKEQSTTVSFVACTIDPELVPRIHALTSLASAVVEVFNDAMGLQAYLQNRVVANEIFSRDIFVVSK